MDRKLGLGAGALALVLGASLGTGVAAASPAPVTLSGAMSCSLTGSYAFSNALTNAGGTPAAITVKAKLKACTGPGSTNGTVTITSGHLVVTSAATVNNSFAGVTSGAALPVLTGMITWSASGGKVNPTTVSLTGQAISYDTGTNVISLYATPVLSGGSYGGQGASTTGNTANTAGASLSAKAIKGVKKIAFGKGGATFTIGA